ncbi:MAG TPA: histidine phosphatase family protein [Anaeromyxobacteraceae bacterium]|nr:histidine phosphatase family protein [Anaeromyxobacteraceae bacterium]
MSAGADGTSLAYLVRHAEAAAGGMDAERPLTAAGRAAFSSLVASLGDSLQVKSVRFSPFRRARETARLLAAATGAPDAVLEDLASGHAGGRELLALLEEAGPGAALVGHNPEVAEAVALAAGRELAVPPGTVAAIDLGGPVPRLSWVRSP